VKTKTFSTQFTLSTERIYDKKTALRVEKWNEKKPHKNQTIKQHQKLLNEEKNNFFIFPLYNKIF